MIIYSIYYNTEYSAVCTILYAHACTHRHTHTHTQLVLVIVFPTARLAMWQTVLAAVHSPHAWGEPSGGNNIGGSIASSDACLILVLVCTTARSGYVGPIQKASQQEMTRLVVPLAAGSLISVAAWPPQCSGIIIPMR